MASHSTFCSSFDCIIAQLLAVAGALAVLGLWTLSRRVSRGRQPAPTSPSRPSEALGATAFLRSRARHSNE